MKLRCEQLEMHFFRKTGDANFFVAVAPLSLSLPEAALTVLMGRSGSGKTTLMNMLSGLLRSTSGRVFLGEDELYAMDDRTLSRYRNRHIAVIPQGQSALPQLSVMENVLLPGMIYEKDRRQDAERRREAAEMLEQLGLGALLDVSPRELSGGELRRLSIARALLMHPDVLCCDEPTADLDDENTRVVLDILKKTAGDGCTVFMVTHEEDAVHYADRLYRMQSGQVTEEK
ncbi:MAG: ABC transporter ATP-binding protein [Clostridia bacterium]|nr:ABC transporter ATP-binding protein [Clostridia bacterium]